VQRARALADVPTEDVFADARSFLPLEGRPPGVVLLLIDELPAADAVTVLRACARAPGRWTPVIVENRERGLRAFSLAPSQDYALEQIARYSRTGEGGLVLRIEHVTDRVRVARHEINNPLAAALVEVQLLLMDAVDDETRRAFGNVQDQLRRIKELVAGLDLPTGKPRQGPAG
jgi:signal transduction histidine kinase